MTQDKPIPELHVDSDWKAEAQAEKDRLSRQEQEKATTEGGPRSRELPAPDFKGLVGALATQAIMGLGAMGDQKTGRVVIDLEGARFSIDLLGVLEEKTKGNLTDDEKNDLHQVVVELRNRFVQITQLLAQQAARTPDPEGGGAPAAGIVPGA